MEYRPGNMCCSNPTDIAGGGGATQNYHVSSRDEFPQLISSTTNVGMTVLSFKFLVTRIQFGLEAICVYIELNVVFYPWKLRTVGCKLVYIYIMYLNQYHKSMSYIHVSQTNHSQLSYYKDQVGTPHWMQASIVSEIISGLSNLTLRYNQLLQFISCNRKYYIYRKCCFSVVFYTMIVFS